MNKPLKFLNAQVNAQGNVKFVKVDEQLADLTSSDNSSAKLPNSEMSDRMALGKPNPPLTKMVSAAVSTAPTGQIQFLSSQGTPVLSGSSILVPQLGTIPFVQNTGSPLQIIQRTTVLHGTGKTPAAVGQTFPIVPCVRTTVPAANAVQVVQNPTGNIQLPEATVQILQDSGQSGIQLVQGQPQVCVKTDSQTRVQPGIQIISNQNSAVQLLSNQAQLVQSHAPVPAVGQTPTLQMVQAQPEGLQFLGPGSVPLITVPNSINVLPKKTVPQSREVNLVNEKDVQREVNSGNSETCQANDRQEISKNVNQNSDVSPVLRHLLKPKFGTTAIKNKSKVIQNEVKKKVRKCSKNKINIQKSKYVDLMRKEKKQTKDDCSKDDKSKTTDKAGLKVTRQPSQTAETPAETNSGKKTEEKSEVENDEDLVVIINKDQQISGSEDAQLSFAGTSVKPKFAIEFSPTNLQTYIQAVANAVENHKALFEQNKTDPKHKKKKNKHRYKDMELEMVVEPPREAVLSKSSRRKQKLCVRDDPSDNGDVVVDTPKPASKKRKGHKVTLPSMMDKSVPAPVTNTSTSSKRSKPVNSGSVVSMRETDEDGCVDVVGESDPSEMQPVKEVGVFIPPSLSKVIVSPPGIQPLCGIKTSTLNTASSEKKTCQSTIADPSSASSTEVTDPDPLPISLDKIKTEPEEDSIPKRLQQKSQESTQVLKTILAHKTIQDSDLPKASCAGNNRDISESVSKLHQTDDKGTDKELPVPVQSIKKEPCQSSYVPLKMIKFPRNSDLNEFENLIKIAKMSSPLRELLSSGKIKHNPKQQQEKTLKQKLQEKLLVSKSLNHHHTPVKEVTALQKMITVYGQDKPVNKVSEASTKGPDLQSNPQIPNNRHPPSVGYQPVTSVLKGFQLGSTPAAPNQPVQVSPGVPAQTVISPAHPTNTTAPGVVPPGPSSTTNVAKLFGPFSFVQNVAPVTNLPNTGTDKQQKVFIVPNSVYSALLSAQVSTGKTVQLTSSQLLSGEVLPGTVVQFPSTNILPCHPSNPKPLIGQPPVGAAEQTPVSHAGELENSSSLSGEVLPSTVSQCPPTNTLPCSSSSPKTLIGQPQVAAAVQTPVSHAAELKKSSPVTTVEKALAAGVPSQGSSQCAAAGTSPMVTQPKVRIVIKDKFLPACNQVVQVGAKETQGEGNKEAEGDMEKISLELRIDSVFSLNKVSCKLLDKVPSYLDMCLNSEHEHSLKLCFVVLDSKLPPMFRGRKGTKRTRLIVPKVCPSGCRTDALDSMCFKNKWHKVKLAKESSLEEMEPVVKRAKSDKKVSFS